MLSGGPDVDRSCGSSGPRTPPGPPPGVDDRFEAITQEERILLKKLKNKQRGGKYRVYHTLKAQFGKRGWSLQQRESKQLLIIVEIGLRVSGQPLHVSADKPANDQHFALTIVGSSLMLMLVSKWLLSISRLTQFVNNFSELNTCSEFLCIQGSMQAGNRSTTSWRSKRWLSIQLLTSAGNRNTL